MKTILCTGDSHTWGQGPAGVEASFAPPVVCGDLRPVPFRFPCYVNLVRDYVNRLTCSEAEEFTPDTELDGQLVIDRPASLARLFFTLEGENNIAHAVLFDSDGETDLGYVKASVGERLTIKPKTRLHLYRAELYRGDYAVINAGVGSCTTRRFLQRFYDGYVKRFSPYAIAAQAHTINDWLNKIPVEETEENLIKILDGCSARKRLLVTVSPIAGETALPFNDIDYSVYIEASRRACEKANAILCDANALIGNDKFSDNWHVNAIGHRIYADEIIKALDLT